MTNASEPDCPFCVLDDPQVTVYADATVQALVSRAPINEYHVIVVPRLHVERFGDLPPNVLVAAVECAQRIGRAITAVARPDGITYITEDDITGQGYNQVAHWKLHVIARFAGDAVRLEWGRVADPGAARRAALAADIRSHLEGAI